MYHTQFFLIVPSRDLVERIKGLGGDFFVDLAEPILWSAQQGDRGVLKRPDTADLVKVLFLETLSRQRSSLAEFRSIFHDLPLCVSSFDAYWTLTAVFFDAAAEDALDESLSEGTIDEMMPSGNAQVDLFLADFKAKRVGRAAQ